MEVILQPKQMLSMEILYILVLLKRQPIRNYLFYSQIDPIFVIKMRDKIHLKLEIRLLNSGESLYVFLIQLKNDYAL
jgi:hypothetical protein